MPSARHERIPALSGAELLADGSRARPNLRAPSPQWGATVSHLSRRRLRLSRGPRRIFPGEPLAGRRSGRDGHRRPQRARLPGISSPASASSPASSRPSFDRVVAVESAPPQPRPSQQICRAQPASAVRAATLDFLRRNAKAGRSDLIGPDLIVVDPPRTGLGAEITRCSRRSPRPRWSTSPATRPRWPATCARSSPSGYSNSNPSPSPTSFPRPFIWRQWSSCAAPDRLDPHSILFNFQARCKPNPPPPRKPPASGSRLRRP